MSTKNEEKEVKEEEEDEEDEEEEEEEEDEEDEEYEDEDEEDEDLNEDEKKELKEKIIFFNKPKKTSTERNIYDNIIKCLTESTTEEDAKRKFTDILKTATAIPDTMVVNRGISTTPQVDPTPLFIAAKKGYYEIVVLLLSKGVDITESVEIKWGKYKGKKYDYFVTPLFVAAMNGHENIVKVLLDKHEEIVQDLNSKYEKLELRLECSRFKNTSIDRVDYSSWEWSSKGEKKKNKKKPPTPLFIAAYAGHCNIIELLVQHKADINWQDDNGMTALFLATEFGKLKTDECLLEQGADPNITTYGDYYRKFSNGWNVIDVRLITPLFVAITREDAYVNFQIIKLLLENNANVDEPVKINDSGWTVNITPLYITVQIAIRSGHSIERRTSLIKIIKLLLRCGADINFKDSEPQSLRRLPFSPLSIVEGDKELKNLLLTYLDTYLDVNLKVNSMYEKMISNNIPQDLASIQSLDMFDKDGISDLAETIKIAREKTESDKTANKLVAKELEKEKKGGKNKNNEKIKKTVRKSKKKSKKILKKNQKNTQENAEETILKNNTRIL